MFLYYHVSYKANLSDDTTPAIARKRYGLYLREERQEKWRSHSQWIRHFITAIICLIRLLIDILEKVNMKKKRTIERITVE
jgi:hypothetical protein